MTPEDAKRLILAQLDPDDGRGEPQTFLGGLRPYRRILPRARFYEIMQALRALAPTFGGSAAVDRELVAALWSIGELTRLWALDEEGMLRSNDLLSDADLATLQRWHRMYSYAVMILLETGHVSEAFSEFDEYLKEEGVAAEQASQPVPDEHLDWIFEDGLRGWLELIAAESDYPFDDDDWGAFVAGLKDTDAEEGRWFTYRLGTEASPALVRVAVEPGTAVIRVSVAGSVAFRRYVGFATGAVQRYKLTSREDAPRR